MTSPNPPLARRVGVAALVLVFVFVGAYLMRRKPAAVAVLEESGGTVDRDFGKHVGAWQPAALRDRFFVGDGVRTDRASHAALKLDDDSELRLASSTVIRFLDKPSKSKAERFDLQMGAASLETGKDAVTLDTDIGAATIAPGTKLSLVKGDRGTRYEVSVGMARFESGGQTVEVGAGQGIEVGIGNASIERYDVKPEGSAAPPPSAAPAPSAEPVAEAKPTGDVTAHVVGGGASIRAPGATTFSRLAAGNATIASGSTLRLARGTSADVALGGERATLRGAGDFVVAEANQPFIVTAGGGVSLTGADTELEVAVPGGSIVARLGARGDVTVKKDATHVSVASGTVDLKTASGDEELDAGEEGTLGAKGSAEVGGRGPGYTDFVVLAGQSFAVHDPHPPTAIGFNTASLCPEGAVAELVGQPGSRSRGTGVVTVLVPAGAHRYAVHCVGANGIQPETAASGMVGVLHDGGTARIPRTAPSTLVDADGRNYTVLYQNILPKISVRWPNAPAGGGYTLTVVSPGGKTATYGSSSPTYSFSSGAWRDGVYRVSFAGGSAKSKETHVDIKFDNAAPAATLTSPADGSFGPGQGVTVSGVALEGWRISVGGTALPLDDQGRFSGEAVAPAGQRALAIEFVHPSRGTHYYLRRGSGH